MVARIEFLDPALEERLEAYAALPGVVAVREHLGWDAGDPLRHFAARPDLLTDQAWREGLGALRRYGFRCVLEVFDPNRDFLFSFTTVSLRFGVGAWS
jgi:hypothetical protein